MNARQGLHERTYRTLLRAYPARYRTEYAEQMVQLFGDQRRREGAGRTWLRAIMELPATAAAEHFRGNGEVGRTSRFLGLLGVLAGALILVGFLGFLGFTIKPDLFNLRLVAYNVGVAAVVIGVHRRQSHAGPRLALSAAIPAVLSNLVYAVVILRVVAMPGEVGPGSFQPIVLTTAAAAAMWLSDAWFGKVTWKLGVLNRWSGIALVIGSLAAFAGMSNWGLADNPLIATTLMAGLGAHGIAWILLGVEVMLRGPRVATDPVA